MEGFDDPGVFFSDSLASENQDDNAVSKQAFKKRFKEFLRQFREGNIAAYKYRDTLKRHYNLRQFHIEIKIEDLTSFDEELADKLIKSPTEFLPLFEEATRDVADEVTAPRPEGEEEVEDIHVTLTSDAKSSAIRDLKSEEVSRLVKIPGIVVAASGIKAKATRISFECRNCRTVIPNVTIKPGLEGIPMPRKCNTEQAGRPKCPVDPFFILPDKCKCVDFQVLKLQEAPDSVPHGEMPRHMQLFVDRSLCEKTVPGNRVTVLGIYSIKKVAKTGRGREKGAVGVRAPYLRVVGIQVETEGPGRASGHQTYSAEEEESFRRLASQPNVFETIAKSIAPSIYGYEDKKKAIACLLFGGSRKRLPDGLTRRGDINVLLLGDPGTAKSQLLKFVERVAPIAVYTSGKGSSAAGLTATVLRDPQSRNFVVEGGAMVLADGGVVCIDEFDKMREDDRVAIHEAMEQQTISIAKAGITTTLNSRCSILAAANSVFGRWDDSKGEENIDFMPTILSRFDTIFIIKDEHSEARDTTLAKHVMDVHMHAAAESAVEGELSLPFLKKFISYCRSRCGPRLSVEAGDKLKNQYVLMRNGAAQAEQEGEQRMVIKITVRQLEAVVRIAESLAKMELQPFATERHVDESLRLFQVSTLDAAMSGTLSGVEGFTTEEDMEEINQIEKQLKKRFAIGTQVSKHAIVQDFSKQNYKNPEKIVNKVIDIMVRRGELQYRLQRKLLYRYK